MNLDLKAVPAPMTLRTGAPNELPVLAALPVPTTNDRDPAVSAALAEAVAAGVAKLREQAVRQIVRGAA